MLVSNKKTGRGILNENNYICNKYDDSPVGFISALYDVYGKSKHL